jgi:hypothetical protein
LARKVALLKASLHKNDFGFTILQKISCSKPPFRLTRTYGLYRLEVGNKLPTFPQELASKRAPNAPKMAKIPSNKLKNH